MTKKRVVVTGMGVVSPFGVGVDTLWTNLLEGNSGIRTFQNINPDDHLVKIGGEVKDFNP